MKNSNKYLAVLFLLFPFLVHGQVVNWTTVNTGTNKNINDVYFQNPDTGYIVGDNHLFRKTTDGGATWQDLPTPAIGERSGNNGNIIAIDFHTSPNFGHLSSGLILTWKKPYYPVVTEDEGLNYDPLFPMDSVLCQAAGFSVMPINNGYTQLAMYGKGCKGSGIISRYMDGSFSTFYIDSTYANKGGFTSIASNDSLTITGHENGSLLSYAPLSFISDTSFLDTSGVDAIAYAGNNTWYASTSKLTYNMYVSTDNGATFKADSAFIPTFFYPNFRDMDFLRNGTGLAGGIMNNPAYGCIFIQNDQGWTYYPADHAINAVKPFSNGTAYAAGDSGLFMKTANFTTNTSHSTKQLDHRIKIYPNPVSDQLNLEKTGNFEILGLRLLNMEGQVVRAFPKHLVRLHLPELSPGVYLLEIQTTTATLHKKVVIRH